MRYLFIIIATISFPAFSSGLNDVSSEYVITFDGVEHGFTNGETKKIKINGKDVVVNLNLGKLKSFNNYGISFNVPQKTSAYLDETTKDLDIWNFDFHDSVFLLMVLKDSNFEISQNSLKKQMLKFSNSMNAKMSEFKKLDIGRKDIQGVSAIGKIGEHRLLIEQYGFSKNNYKFLAYTYYPIMERKNRDIKSIYINFKNIIFNSLEI